MLADPRVVPVHAAPMPVDRVLGAVRVDHLIELGWDPVTGVFTPDPAHRQLGYRVCPVAGCGGEGRLGDGLCCTCALRRRSQATTGMAEFCARGLPGHRSPPRLCLVCRVPGFERPTNTKDLCISCGHQRALRGQSVEAFVHGDDRYPPAQPRPGMGTCRALSCQRLAAHLNGTCDAHYQLWRAAGFPELDAFLAAGTPRHGDLRGRIVMAGLPEGVVAEVLYGIQCSLAAGRKLRPPALRSAVGLLRQAGVASVADLDVDAIAATKPSKHFLVLTADRLRLLGADPEVERTGDVWDLRLWGRSGRLSFVGGEMLHRSRGELTRPLTQCWLREAAKAWAADALATKHPNGARRMVAALGMFSEHLARRPDRGELPGAIARADIEAFFARLGRLQAAGAISADRRSRTQRALAMFLRDARALGLTKADGPMAGLADDVATRRSDQPRAQGYDAGDVGLALPPEVLAALLDEGALAVLESLFGPTVRAAFELQAGVGRRTAELCSLAFACLGHDDHIDSQGERQRAAVLVHDMPKAGRLGLRLPIHQREAAIIAAQQVRVTAQFNATPAVDLALFPRRTKNPDGTTAMSPAYFQRALRVWVDTLPELVWRDGGGEAIPFPKERVVPYALRHSFAQRHADAGTPVDTLRDLMGHSRIQTTLGYYRVTNRRKRAAQDRLGPLQLDAAARLVRPGIAELADAQALREQVGQVAVPFGVCTEPTNVAAEGRSCPFRHRCLGCEYFRTDPSYQPELAGYLARLLEDGERVAAATALAEWARRDAAPAPEEIEALRRLVRANDEAVAATDDEQRALLEDAIAVLRTDRARLATTFPVEFRGLVRQSHPELFPTIERLARPGRTGA